MDINLVGKKEDGWSGRTSRNGKGKDEKRCKDLEILLARQLIQFKMLSCVFS